MIRSRTSLWKVFFWLYSGAFCVALLATRLLNILFPWVLRTIALHDGARFFHINFVSVVPWEHWRLLTRFRIRSWETWSKSEFELRCGCYSKSCTRSWIGKPAGVSATQMRVHLWDYSSGGEQSGIRSNIRVDSDRNQANMPASKRRGKNNVGGSARMNDSQQVQGESFGEVLFMCSTRTA